MNKTDALAKLQKQIDDIEPLKRKERFSPDFKKWYRDTEIVIEKIFGKGTRHGTDFTGIRYSMMAYSTSTPDSAFTRAFIEGLDDARSVLESLIREVNEYWEDDSQAPKRVDAISVVGHLCMRFHLVAKQLRTRHDGRESLQIEDEYDVQDLLRSLLALHFDDVRPEEWTPSYAGASSRMDFLLKAEDTVVEVKKTRKGLAAKEVGDQLLIDIQRYQSHPSCKSLICFVYDPEGRVSNPTGIERDLSKQHEGMNVVVIIAPKGT